jgi:uncharacterized membrane protein
LIMLDLKEVELRFIKAIGLVSALCVAMFFIRAFATGVTRFVLVPENLALAWLALVFAWILVGQLKVRRWASWQNITLSVLWLLFLPNTWYVLTDFVHVVPGGDISQIYDIVMMSTLVIAGFTLGFTSLIIVHKEFLKRWSKRRASGAVAVILLLASFAIYLGRDLRWSTWDVVTNPSGIILNVSDRVIDPFGHPRALNVTLLFFGLLSTLYLAIWQLLGPHHSSKR